MRQKSTGDFLEQLSSLFASSTSLESSCKSIDALSSCTQSWQMDIRTEPEAHYNKKNEREKSDDPKKKNKKTTQKIENATQKLRKKLCGILEELEKNHQNKRSCTAEEIQRWVNYLNEYIEYLETTKQLCEQEYHSLNTADLSKKNTLYKQKNRLYSIWSTTNESIKTCEHIKEQEIKKLTKSILKNLKDQTAKIKKTLDHLKEHTY